ncbi:MAG: acyl transferase [Bacteroidetes bacterium]|nr:acyl transferase [Bacteroidota bacterium]
MSKSLTDLVFGGDQGHFDERALRIFGYQYEHTPVYREFCDAMHRPPDAVKSIYDIPFLPVQFFKSHAVIDKDKAAQKIFESSATTGSIPSRHMVADLSLYEQSYLNAFQLFYGSPDQYCILALLPSYIERGTSSLLYMADHLIRLSGNPLSGFINKDFTELNKRISAVREIDKKVLLLGVTYALLDFAEEFPQDLSGAIIMETGGMKGQRNEMTRSEVHSILKKAFSTDTIHSEYGMTELLSQAYSKGEGIFNCPPWMKVSVRDPYDPMAYLPVGKTGLINIIDLANLYSCSFLAVSDLGRIFADGSFEVMGRLDQSEIRGCNLMYEL